MASTEANPIRRIYLGLQAWKMESFERAVFASVPYATAVSPKDADQIARWGCPRVQYVPNGVDLARLSVLPRTEVDPALLVFVGSMDWRANQDAVRWFLAEIHPRLSRLCDFRLRIVGRNPPGWLLDRNRVPSSVEATGEVEDVKPHLGKAAVVVVPLRVGGGSRLKILEAFACGRAVVSTSIGAEGLEVENGRDLILADSPDDFAEAVARLLRDEGRREELVRRARCFVESKHGWDRIAESQAVLWREAIGRSAR